MSDLSPPTSPIRTHTMSPFASSTSSSPDKRGPLDPSSSSPAPNENMSPSRQAILDRFNKIKMGPPPSVAQPDCGGGVKLSSSGSPHRSSRNSQSPFKRALMNSQRSNTGASGSSNGNGSPSKNAVPPVPSSDVSLSLNFSSSVRLSANTSVEYDLMNAPDDSLFAEAKNMGEESFERRLMQNCSPAPARRRMSPRREREQRQSPLRRNAPQQGNSIGLGLGLPTGRRQAQADSSSTGIRSLSMSSDVSNIFDEKGEESLLYASMRIKAKPAAKRGAKEQKLLTALAEDKEEDVLAINENKGEAAAMQSKPSAPQSITSPNVKRTAASSSDLPARAKSIVPVSGSGMTPSNSRDKLPSSAVKKVIPSSSVARSLPSSTTPRLSTAMQTSAAASSSSRVSASTRAPPASSASTSARAPPLSTPRSRPPLNASAARLRRLSTLPQLMDEQGKPKPPASTTRVGVGAKPVVKPYSQPAVSPARNATAGSTSPVVRRTIGRPSVAGSGATPSATPRSRAAVAMPAHRMNDSTKTSSRFLRAPTGALASRTDGAAAAPGKESAVSGQLQRRAPSMLPSAHEPASSAAKRPLARPFPSGKGTSHSVHGDNPPLVDKASLPASPGAFRKSIATTNASSRVPPVHGRMGIPKSSSASQVASRAAGVGAGTPTAGKRSTTAATALPRPSLARPA